jgi:energy-coupling factor transporter ATP-binding protein EcfA2
MITNVMAINFKGRDLDVKIGPKTIIYGPNGTGKSAIVQALELAINGHVSGGTYRTNAAILEAFGGGGNKIYVEAAVNGGKGAQLARQFVRDDKGTVSQNYMVDRRRVDAKGFAQAVGSSGAPKLVALQDFLDMSPSKMIYFLADFAGGNEILELAADSEALQMTINKSRGSLRENEGYVSRTMAGIAALGLPPGSISEVQDEIKQVETDLAKAKADLRQEKKDEEQRRKEEMKKNILANAEKAKEEMTKAEPVKDPTANLCAPSIENVTPRSEYKPSPEGLFTEPFGPANARALSAQGSIQKIIDAIVALNCPACSGGFVLLVAKNELKKWEDSCRK